MPCRAVDARDARINLAIHEPAEHRAGAVGGIGDHPVGDQVELVFHPCQHGLRRPKLSLPDGTGAFDVQDHTVIRVDQIIVGIAKERRPFARSGLLPTVHCAAMSREALAGGVGM